MDSPLHLLPMATRSRLKCSVAPRTMAVVSVVCVALSKAKNLFNRVLGDG